MMDAGKSQDLQGELVSQRLRRASGVLVVPVSRLEAWDPENADVLVWV